ncbi:MAG: NAD(+) synthase [Bacteriovoracaceae bacterium]|nr:NAD(+) synthase [Bacteriovoracaceae bacterium]
MNIYLHQTHHLIADFKGIRNYLEGFFSNNHEKKGIHVFPELFLTGYPLQDLCLKSSFINSYLDHLAEINNWCQKLSKTDDVLILIGGLKYKLTPSGLPEKLENVIFKLVPGRPIENIATKILLPDYDIFDEKKYFTPGKTPTIFSWNKLQIGLLVCEDMWPNSSYDIDPVLEIDSMNNKLDVIINLSASPYNLHKHNKRIKRACEISNILKAPFVYTNRVGSEDGIIFDGASFAVNGNNLVLNGKSFEKDILSFKLPEYNCQDEQQCNSGMGTTWEGLFSPELVKGHGATPIVRSLDEEDCDEIIQALGFGVQEYAEKCGIKNFLVALSGGMDSSLVLAILKLSLKKRQTLEAIYMPSEFSTDLSFDLSKKLCKNLDIPLKIFPISELHNDCRDLFSKNIEAPLVDLADENIQSRLRSTILMARANQLNAIAINTSNKSELAVGYSTIYGDSVGGISMLGDIYKSEVYMLGKYLNKKHAQIIPEEIITRPPSAELRENQKDIDSLPPYERLDAILEGILSYRLSLKDLVHMGFDSEEVCRVFQLYKNSEYKRIQFCPIVKIKAKSFGFGYRIPICKDSAFYFNERL